MTIEGRIDEMFSLLHKARKSRSLGKIRAYLDELDSHLFDLDEDIRMEAPEIMECEVWNDEEDEDE